MELIGLCALLGSVDGSPVDVGQRRWRWRKRRDVLDDGLELAVSPLDWVTRFMASLETIEDSVGDRAL